MSNVLISVGSWEVVETWHLLNVLLLPFGMWSWHPYNLWLSLSLLAELARMAKMPFGWLVFQYTLYYFLSPQAYRLPIGNAILWISCFPCCVTFNIYMWSVLSALSNPMFFPCCTVCIPVIAQGFAELTLLLFFLLTSPYRNLTFYQCPTPCIKIACQHFPFRSPLFVPYRRANLRVAMSHGG